jgi:hypothetical protein
MPQIRVKLGDRLYSPFNLRAQDVMAVALNETLQTVVEPVEQFTQSDKIAAPSS